METEIIFLSKSSVFRFKNVLIMISLLKFKETLRGKCPNTGKYGPEKTPYVDTFYAVKQYILS